MTGGTVQGIIEGVNQKFDGGLLIQNEWYNGTRDSGADVKARKKGEEVRLTWEPYTSKTSGKTYKQIQTMQLLTAAPAGPAPGPAQSNQGSTAQLSGNTPSIMEIAGSYKAALKEVLKIQDELKSEVTLDASTCANIAMHLNTQFWKNERTPRG